MAMDRKRIREEVIEILAAKLHNLPPLSEGEGVDYDRQVLIPEITGDPLDIAEVSMDLEDAFGINFEDVLPGDPGMEDIGKIIDFIEERIRKQHRATVRKDAEAAE